MCDVIILGHGASVSGIVRGEDHGERPDGAGERGYEEEDAQLLLVRPETPDLVDQVLIRHNHLT